MKLLVVDDQAIVRQGIAALLIQADAATVVLQARDSADGLELAGAHADLDAIFLDLAMPGVGGMAAIAAFGRRRPAVPLIVLSASDDPVKVRQAFDHGALGYVPKSASAETLLAALQLVLRGEAFVPALLLSDRPPIRANTARGRRTGSLTERQAEVLGCLALGLSNKAIGRRLGVAEKTVKAHVTAVLRGLAAANRGEAVERARAGGLI
ncbi:MAG TPA: response regulator transcription factor [Caulobacteraceae bacterium]